MLIIIVIFFSPIRSVLFDSVLVFKIYQFNISCLLEMITCIKKKHFAGQNVRKLIKDGLIIRKPQAVHSRARVRENTIARRKGRHTGRGKYLWCKSCYFLKLITSVILQFLLRAFFAVKTYIKSNLFITKKKQVLIFELC